MLFLKLSVFRTYQLFQNPTGTLTIFQNKTFLICMLFINAIVISRKKKVGKHLALLKLDLKSDKSVGCLTKGGKKSQKCIFPFKRYGITYTKCSGSAFDTITGTG